MANGDTVREIKALLSEEGAIKTQTALRLSLDLQMQIFEKWEKQDAEIKLLTDKLEKVERASVVLWIQNNPKLALFTFTVYIVVASLVDFKEVLAQAIGIK